MTLPRILNVEPSGYSAEASAVIATFGDVTARAMDRRELLLAVADADVLITRLGHAIDVEVLQAAPRLRAVVTATTGLDHIDLAEARRRGIQVISLRGETDFLRGVPATAELTWALLLAAIRRIPRAHADVVAGHWNRDAFRGNTLAGKRLGILGFGRVGTQVAAYGRAFGMHVGAVDPTLSPWPADTERFSDARALAEWCDVLSVHVPLSDDTVGLLDAPVLDALGPQGWLVNTARGAIVDEEALVAALERNAIAGAGLDVVGGGLAAPPATRARLLEFAQAGRIVITPHIGGATAESMAATEEFVARKLVQWWQTNERPKGSLPHTTTHG